jgi:DNA-binding MarR family transcriptional regulator
LEPIFVSKLARALENAGLIQRAEHLDDPRAVQLHLTQRGTEVVQRAIGVVMALQEELTAPIGGTTGQTNRELVRTLQILLGNQNRSESVTSPAPATLSGQDVGEAEGALSALLSQTLDRTNSDINRTEFITLRVLALRGAVRPPATLHDFLASQPQMGIDRSQVAELLHSLEARGLISGSDPAGPGPVQLTAHGAVLYARLSDAVGMITQRLYADLDPGDLSTAHRVLVNLTERARRLRADL